MWTTGRVQLYIYYLLAKYANKQLIPVIFFYSQTLAYLTAMHAMSSELRMPHVVGSAKKILGARHFKLDILGPRERPRARGRWWDRGPKWLQESRCGCQASALTRLVL